MESSDEEQPFLQKNRKMQYPHSKDVPERETQRSGWRCDEIWERLGDEWKLYNYHMLGVVMWTNLFVLWFFTLGILRNVAYYRHVPGPNLPDLAFDFIEGNNSEIVKKIIEICFFSMAFGLAFLLFVGNVIYQPPHMPRIYTMPHFIKGLCGYHLGLLFRAFIFCSTSIPGSAAHCHPDMDSMYWVRKPKSLLECFTFVNLSYPNCGDLIFSGHVFSTLFWFNMLEPATRSIFGYHPRLHKWIFRLLHVGIIYQSYEIVVVRNHYTVDVLLAFIFTPLYSHWFDKIKFFDIDPRKSVAEIQDSGKKQTDVMKRLFSILDYFRSRRLVHAIYCMAQMGFVFYLVKHGLARLQND